MSFIGGIDLGNLPDYLFFFENGSNGANWQGISKGFIGDVAVDGIQANESTSDTIPYAGTVNTNDNTLSAWQNVVDNNVGQANASYSQAALVSDLKSDLFSAFQEINALAATPGFENVSAASLDGLDTTNGTAKTYVINITSGFNVTSKINITGDAGDVYVLRWDTDADPSNGYQGQVSFSNGGAIVPNGALTASNFIHVAGDIVSLGGGTTPLAPYPQGPRDNDGQGALITGGSDFSGGGFFTGYWLTTGSPDNYNAVEDVWYGQTSVLTDGIFVGGWYSITNQFSMTSGTSGVYVSPNQATLASPSVEIKKYVSPDNGVTWLDAQTAPGPTISSDTSPRFKYVITNTGNVTLTNVVATDDVYGAVGALASLDPGLYFQVIRVEAWGGGQHTNIATVTAEFDTTQLTDSDPANYFGEETGSIEIIKYVSPDNGVTWLDAQTAPGPVINNGTSPQFKYVIRNTGNVTVTNIVVTDDVYGAIGSLPSLDPGLSFEIIRIKPWESGQHTNTATVTAEYNTTELTDSDSANYFGEEAVGIIIKKYVSPNDGITWFDAEVAPGPTIISGTDPQFKYVVTNTGGENLTNVVVTDDIYGMIGSLPSLVSGANFEWIITRPWMSGQQTNVATVTAEFDTTQLSDTDSANYFGEEGGSIEIKKYVSPDNGVTWLDAQTAPGPTISSGTSPRFKYVVTNTGNVTLTNVIATDDVYGAVGSLPSLDPGLYFQVIRVEAWESGQHTNIATVTAEYDTMQLSDSDPANYFGEEAGSIKIKKYVSTDNGATWIDANSPPGPYLMDNVAPKFKYVVTNTGSIILTNVEVTDSVLGFIGSIPSLAPAATFEWIV